jgi:GntR family transcriptional regulator/MocR family aminotransferase
MMALRKVPDREEVIRPDARRRRRAASAPDTLIVLDARSPVPLYQQIYARVREGILAGRFPSGMRVPSTRELASELEIARVTVNLAFDQLRAEGYLETRARAGTFVARTIPDTVLHAARTRPARVVLAAPGRAPRGGAPAQKTLVSVSSPPRLSARGMALSAAVMWSHLATGRARAFRTGLPALDAFPSKLWLRLTARQWRRPGRDLLGYGDPLGHAPLRRAIAQYAAAARGVRCTADQVVVVSGSQQALDLTARVLLDPGDEVWMEDPGYLGARAAFVSAGAKLASIPLDREGIDVTAGMRLAPRARLVYTTPSHQYPLGVTMSAARRLALLDWTARSGAWVVEDDYDSELRYTGRPLASLQGMTEGGRVVYVGTFSKTLFPALRLGYVIVAPALVDVFRAAVAAAGRQAPTVGQAVLAEFIAEGHFARHVRRMRALYGERQAALIGAACEGPLGEHLDLTPAAAGMHVVGWVRDGSRSDVQLAAAALAAGVEARALTSHTLSQRVRPALLLGYAAFSAPILRRAAERLAVALSAEHGRGDTE